jgi:hypothetical protein
MRIRVVFVVALVAAAAFAGRLANPVAIVSAQKAVVAPPHSASPEQTAAAAEVLALDQTIGTAVVRGDTAYVDSVTPSDFVNGAW